MREKIEKENPSENFEVRNNNEFIGDLASFFDLLAQFNYEDKKKEKLALNSGLLASAPRKSELGSNYKN
jgi:hypothetical protein